MNCGPPSAPSHGHFLPYTSTLEGATVTYVCWTIYQEANISLSTEINTTAVCNKNGNWEPVSLDMCSIFSGNCYYLYILWCSQEVIVTDLL